MNFSDRACFRITIVAWLVSYLYAIGFGEIVASGQMHAWSRPIVQFLEVTKFFPIARFFWNVSVLMACVAPAVLAVMLLIKLFRWHFSFDFTNKTRQSFRFVLVTWILSLPICLLLTEVFMGELGRGGRADWAQVTVKVLGFTMLTPLALLVWFLSCIIAFVAGPLALVIMFWLSLRGRVH